MFATISEPIYRAFISIKGRKLLWLLVLILTIVYSSLSILRHWHFTSTAYDLGIFDQAIWLYSRLGPAYGTVRAHLPHDNLLGDHFHPILILLAPLYWFTDRVEALLIAQAFLFAVAIVPIFLFTEKRVGKVAAYLFCLSYSIFWGIQKAVEFDFHEIAFAVPLTALAIYFIDEERWPPYFVCLGLLLLTKENLSILVFFFGVFLLVTKRYKQGLISIGAGAFWFLAATKIFIPYFLHPDANKNIAPGNYYRYWSYSQFGSGPLSALARMVRDPLLVIQTLLSPATKLHTYWYLFHPFLFLTFFSPWFIVAIPLLAERFLSANSNYWTTDFHYTAVLVPVLVMASADGLARITRELKVRPQYLIVPVSCVVLLLNVRLLPEFPLWQLKSVGHWRLSNSDKVGQRALSLIPRDASVAAQGPITPHLSHRRRIYVLHPMVNFPDPDFIIASDRISPYPMTTMDDVKRYLAGRQTKDYRKIFEEDGWVVLQRGSTPAAKPELLNDAAFVEQSVPDLMASGQTYDVHVTLKNTGIKAWSAHELYRLAYLSGNRDWILERVELPSTVPPGAIARFDFKVTAPAKPGRYSFHWGMVQDGVAAFGERAPQVWVTVVQ